ncbi:MAG: thioredoxin family protein [Bacteroidales bacterium]
MTIKVLGTGCSACKSLFDVVKQSVEEMGVEAVLLKVEDIGEIMTFNTMLLPALVINERVVAKGKGIRVEEVKQLIEKSR